MQYKDPPKYEDIANQIGIKIENNDQSNALEIMLRILSEYDIHVVIDDSGSMALSTRLNDQSAPSRWDDAIEATTMIMNIGTVYDDDGVDVHFLNHKHSYNIKKGEIVTDKLKNIGPRGATPIGARLVTIFNEFLQKLKTQKEVKPINVIVITDGEPTDKDLVKKCIGDLARILIKMGYDPKNMCGIQFFQVGDDMASTKYLESLDDELHKEQNIPDIVDSTCYNPSENLPLRYIILKSLLGGIDGDVDNDKFKVLFKKN